MVTQLSFLPRSAVRYHEGPLHPGRGHEVEVLGQHRDGVLAVKRQVSRGLQAQAGLARDRHGPEGQLLAW